MLIISIDFTLSQKSIYFRTSKVYTFDISKYILSYPKSIYFLN